VSGPGAGAHGIQHSAYSPRTGWWYTTDLEICSTLKGGEGAGAPILNPTLRHKSAPLILHRERSSGHSRRSITTCPRCSRRRAIWFSEDLEGTRLLLTQKQERKLWSFNTGGRIVAAPVSFFCGGRQFVTISSGGGAKY